MKTRIASGILFLSAVAGLTAAASELGPVVLPAGAARLDNGSLVTLGQPLAGVFGTPGAGISGHAGFVPVVMSPEPPPPPAPPEIGSDYGPVEGGFRLTFEAASGYAYEVQASTNLVDWTPLWNTGGLGLVVEFTDKDALFGDQRFYRVVAQ